MGSSPLFVASLQLMSREHLGSVHPSQPRWDSYTSMNVNERLPTLASVVFRPNFSVVLLHVTPFPPPSPPFPTPLELLGEQSSCLWLQAFTKLDLIVSNCSGTKKGRYIQNHFRTEQRVL